jgi:hypothetical protein
LRTERFGVNFVIQLLRSGFDLRRQLSDTSLDGIAQFVELLLDTFAHLVYCAFHRLRNFGLDVRRCNLWLRNWLYAAIAM